MLNLTFMNTLEFTVMLLILIIQFITISIQLFRTHSKETKMLLSLLLGQGIVLVFILSRQIGK